MFKIEFMACIVESHVFDIYIYMYVSAVELLSGPSLAFLIVTNWAKFV